jgi:hypothetical protein
LRYFDLLAVSESEPNVRAVEAAAEGDDARPVRVVARELEARLDGLRPRVREERLPVMVVGADLAGEVAELLADRAVPG